MAPTTGRCHATATKVARPAVSSRASSERYGEGGIPDAGPATLARYGKVESDMASATATAEEEGRPLDARGKTKESIHGRFGSGYENITGMAADVIEHDDRGAKIWLGSAVVWFIVVTTFGLIIATELAMPEMFAGVPWLIFSRVRPSHVEGVIYAWLTMMYWGAILYFSPRLLGTRSMWSEKLLIYTAWFYNLTLAVGFFGILSGASQGREYAEFPWLVDVAIIIVFALNIVNMIMTVAIRKVRPLYVSMWWALAAPIWVSISIFIENVMWRPGNIWGNPSGYLPLGHHDAMINWWGNHNLFGLWLTPILVAVVYYFVPRITNTPLYSHTLSLISFWGIIFVYAAVGDHHIMQSPTPGWLKTIAAVNSLAILGAVFAFFTNIFLTMRGQWSRFQTSLPLRYILTGWLFYIAVNLQGALQAQQPFNVYIHFTYFIVGHSHLALLGGFTILGMGVIYYVLPHVWRKVPYSRALAEWQYWLVTGGFTLFFVAVTIGGYVQGQGWNAGLPEINVLPALTMWNIIRGIAGVMIYASAWIQGYQVLRTYLSDTRARASRAVVADTKSALGESALRA
jgi:cbb3-type cytochrome c oxidase subunit I